LILAINIAVEGNENRIASRNLRGMKTGLPPGTWAIKKTT
jgi:hypothetical protein